MAPKNLHAVLESFYFDELDAPIVVDADAALQPDLRKAFLKRSAAAGLPDAVRREPGFRDFVKNLFELEDKELKPYFRDGVLVDTLKNGLAIYAKYGVDIVTENAEVIGANGVLIKNRDRGILEVLDEIKAIEKKVAALNAGLAGIRAGLDAGRRRQAREGRAAAERRERAERPQGGGHLPALAPGGAEKEPRPGREPHPAHRRRDRRLRRGDGEAERRAWPSWKGRRPSSTSRTRALERDKEAAAARERKTAAAAQ